MPQISSSMALNPFPGQDFVTSTPRIPSNLLSHIFSKVPVKSLCRFKCVSKSWFSIIHDNNFHRSVKKPIVVRLTQTVGKETSLHLYSIVGTGAASLICKSTHGVLCIDSKSCNGLICFRNPMVNNLEVCNLTTQEVVSLTERDGFTFRFSFEFGFDPLTKKYKVLAWGGRNFNYMVYTLGTESWRQIKSRPAGKFSQHSTRSFCMDGTFYWYSTDKESVISFNLADEKFGVIQGPRRIERGLDRMVMNLFELEGCLCLVDYHYLGRDQSRKRILDLWMSKDFKCGEWVLMTSIALPQEAMSLEIPCCTRPGEIVLAKSSDRSRVLYLYSILTRKLNKMKVDGVPLTFGDPLSCLVTNHVENFVSLKNL